MLLIPNRFAFAVPRESLQTRRDMLAEKLAAINSGTEVLSDYSEQPSRVNVEPGTPDYASVQEANRAVVQTAIDAVDQQLAHIT